MAAPDEGRIPLVARVVRSEVRPFRRGRSLRDEPEGLVSPHAGSTHGDERLTAIAGAGGSRRSRYVVWLIVLGALISVAGLVFGLVAKASAEQSALGSNYMQFFPVHVFTQYTQHRVPDYFGLWTGLGVAVIGMGIVMVGAILALRRHQVRARRGLMS